MMENSKRIKNNGACCRDDVKMVRCATAALEKMKDLFGVALGSLTDPFCEPVTAPNGCIMDTNCKVQACPFRGTGVAPNVLQTLCKTDRKPTANGRSDRYAMRLLPGEVGLRGDRATFHLGRNAGQPVPLGEDGRPTGAVYYNLRPPVAGAVPTGKPGAKQLQHQPRKHVMQVLPTLPTSKDPLFGPVTGMPVAEDEHLFVLNLSKRYDEQDEKARLQIELRLPKDREPERIDASTLVVEEDLDGPPVPPPEPEQSTMTKKKKNKAKKSAKKGKK